MGAYFNIPELGELCIEQELFGMDITMLAICKDRKMNRYLALCIEEYSVEKYMILKSEILNIVRMLDKEITMEELFKMNPDGKVWYVSAGASEVITGRVCDIREENLPTAGAMYRLSI